MDTVTIIVPGGSVKVDRATAKMCEMFASDDGNHNVYTIERKIPMSTLCQVMEWCEHYADKPTPNHKGVVISEFFSRHIKDEFAIDFFQRAWNDDNLKPIYALADAVNYLAVPSIVHCLIIRFACFVVTKNPRQIYEAIKFPVPAEYAKLAGLEVAIDRVRDAGDGMEDWVVAGAAADEALDSKADYAELAVNATDDVD